MWRRAFLLIVVVLGRRQARQQQGKHRGKSERATHGVPFHSIGEASRQA
jgi:hypothetical protein